MTIGDDQVSSVKILAYSDGILLESAYFRETDRMTLSLEKGRSYNLYALAGMGDPAVPSEEDELPEFYLECLESAETLRELADDLYHGCPMEQGNKLFDLDWDYKYLNGGQ